MTVKVHGVPMSIDAVGWSLLMADLSRAGDVMSVPAGLVASASGSNVSVSAGRSMQVGTLAISDATTLVPVTANTSASARLDMLVMQVDWSGDTNTAGSLRIIEGTPGATPVLPALVQVPGVKWQTPLARIKRAAGSATVASADVEVCKPLPRVAKRFVGSPIASKTISYSASPSTISSVTIPDPGWPYLLEIDGAGKFDSASSGYGYLHVAINGAVVETGRSPRLTNDGAPPVSVRTITEVLTGAVTVALRMEPAFMSSGSLVLISGTNCWFNILQIPA